MEEREKRKEEIIEGNAKTLVFLFENLRIRRNSCYSFGLARISCENVAKPTENIGFLISSNDFLLPEEKLLEEQSWRKEKRGTKTSLEEMQKP